MTQLTLQLPDTLFSQLETLAQIEGVQLTQYILYALTRQVVSAYTMSSFSKDAVQQQKIEFDALLQRLGNAPLSEVEAVLGKRDVVKPEPELSPEIVSRLQHRIARKSVTQ